MSPRLLHLSAAALLIAAAPFDISASAQPHKPRRASPAATARDADPETTATIPATPMPHAPDPGADASDGERLPTPFRLPAASHARMRDCGLKWRAMKMSGEAGDDIWRDFAAHCLAAANGPLDGREPQQSH